MDETVDLKLYFLTSVDDKKNVAFSRFMGSKGKIKVALQPVPEDDDRFRKIIDAIINSGFGLKNLQESNNPTKALGDLFSRVATETGTRFIDMIGDCVLFTDQMFMDSVTIIDNFNRMVKESRL